MQVAQNLISKIPIFCKLIYITSLTLYVTGLVFAGIPLKLCNYPHRVEVNGEIYRLFLPFLSKGYSILSIISLIVDFLWIRFFFTKIQKACSTIFFTIQIFIQNLVLQLVFSFLAVILIHAGILDNLTVSYGWSPLIVIMIFKKVHSTADSHYKLLCFNIPKKYIPYIIVVLSLFYSYHQFFCILVAIGLGYLQFVIIGKHFVRLPLGLYLGLEKMLPDSIKKRDDYVKVRNVQNQIVDECCQCGGSIGQSGDQQSKAKKTKKERKTSKVGKTIDFELNEQMPNPSTVPMPQTQEQLQR